MSAIKVKLDFILNGKKQVLNVNPSDRISKVLREDLGLMGTKVGCNLSLIHISEPTRPY